jgi:methyltransferase
VTGAIVLLAVVTAQRIGELILARRNTRRLLARGGVEHGRAHYPLIVGLHAAWLAGLWWMAWEAPLRAPWLVAYLGLQAFRVWILASLGARWTTRIITVPGEALVRRGPYRVLRHPNYLLVAAEIAVLPLVFGLWGFALTFSVLNGLVLAIRIRAEARALRPARA